MFGAMAIDEARRVKKTSLRATARVVGPALSMLMRALDPVVNIGTFATSTYLHEHDDATLVLAAAESARERCPHHVRVLRSIDAVRTPRIVASLAREGWLIIPARKVWYYYPNDERLAHRRELHHDQRLLERTTFKRRALMPEDAESIVSLYEQLYLGKYSRWNPLVRAEAVRALIAGGGLSGEGFTHDGALVGVAAYFDATGVMTTPILGYDLSLPQSLGLYRLLSMIILERAQQLGLLLHASAGADGFKRLRGAEAALEYVAIDVRGVSSVQSGAWKLVAAGARGMEAAVFGSVSTG